MPPPAQPLLGALTRRKGKEKPSTIPTLNSPALRNGTKSKKIGNLVLLNTHFTRRSQRDEIKSRQMSTDCDAIQECPIFQDAFADDDGAYADDATWVLTSSIVILTMQSGFGLLEMGHSTAGNEVNIMLKNVYDVVFGGLAYYLLGFGISYGSPSTTFMGLGSFVPIGDPAAEIESGLLYSRYLFHFSFAATSTTIVSGCVAMRIRFFVYCAFSFYAVIVYSFAAHWVWAEDGWLANMGVHDWAGSGPVHLLGASNGLIAVLFLGPRTGRFDESRPKSDFAPASPTSMLFGLFMLWWGWIGFNCGSTFGITDAKWMVATRAAVTTVNASVGGGLAGLAYTQIRTKGKNVLPCHAVDGIMGALVAITASCACVRTYAALIIGAIGSIIAVLTNEGMANVFKVDDPVGAIGVHGAAGIWGVIAVGLFADERLPGVDVDSGLFRGGGFRLLGVQCLEIVSIMGWSALCMPPFFYLTGVLLSHDWKNPRKGLRLSMDEELHGADEFLHDCNDLSKVLLEQSQRFSHNTSKRRLDDLDGADEESQQGGSDTCAYAVDVVGEPLLVATESRRENFRNLKYKSQSVSPYTKRSDLPTFLPTRRKVPLKHASTTM